VAVSLEQLGAVALARGARVAAEEHLLSALSEAEAAGQAGMFFAGPPILGRLQIVADDAAERASYHARGLELLEKTRRGRSVLEFFRSSIEAALLNGELDSVEGYAKQLEEYADREPLAWATFYAGRGRALAALKAGEPIEAWHAQLRRLDGQASRSGLLLARHAITAALSGSGDSAAMAANVE
jgi:hypothetical protein